MSTPLAPHLSARTGLIRGYVPALHAFDEHRRALQRQAVLGHGPLLGPLLAARRGALARLRELAWLRQLADSAHRRMRLVLASGAYDGLLPLAADDLATLMELRLPYLADSTVLRHPTHAPATEILPRLPLLRRRAPQVRAVLAASSLDETGTPFRSEPDDDGLLVVRGRDAPTVEALAGIAHELGHCLYERARPVRCALGQIASERLAQHLEEQATAQYLEARGGPRERRAWWVYQRRVDAVNLHFFALERSLTYGDGDDSRGGNDSGSGSGIDGTPPPELLPETATVLRESLFTVPGYQVVYAHASLARLPTPVPAHEGGTRR
ncbi:hypothetical protein ACX6XY_08665 [Streptomyces sp. O3]